MRLVYTLLLPLSFTLPLSAADWPQWMGPNRDGVWPETGIVEKFPEDGPKDALADADLRAGTPAPPSRAARCTSPIACSRRAR